MHPMSKLGLSIVSILGLITAIWFGLLVEPTSRWVMQIEQLQFEQPWLSWLGVGLAILTGLTFLMLLLIALFRRSTSQNLNVASDKGNLSISRRAIEKSVNHAVREHHPVVKVDSQVTFRKNQESANARVNAQVNQSQGNLVDETKAIETTVKRALTEKLGVNVNKVNVRLSTVTSNDKRSVDIV